MDTSITSYEIAVVGGGMIGAATALGLARLGCSVVLIEPEESVEPYVLPEQPDLRVSAISHASVMLLKQLGAWDNIIAMRATPYRQLFTWEQEGHQINFDASCLGLTELGFMVENRVVQNGILQQLRQETLATIYTAEAVSKMEAIHDGWQLTLKSGKYVIARLVIGADGANSLVRQLAGIGITGWQYRQTCMLITVKTDKESMQDTTWQRFYPSGPRAFLPLHDGYATLVWYDSPSRIQLLSQLSMERLTTEVMMAFPPYIGNVTALTAGSFPLVRRHAQQYVKSGIVLLGDAAHTIHPLAGQGVNLGYRDLNALLAILEQARQEEETWYNEDVLLRYQRKRQFDNLIMQSSMDLFYKVFSNDLPPLKALRNFALTTAQHSGKLKNIVLKYALGL